MSAEEVRYFVKHRGRVQGPLTIDDVQRAIKRGRVTRAHSVSRDGISWAPASDYADLFGTSPRQAVPYVVASPAPATPEVENRPVDAPAGETRNICWSCPHCRTLLTVSEQDAGATAECPFCGKTSVAPGGHGATPSVQPTEWEQFAAHLRRARPWVRCISVIGFVQTGLCVVALIAAPLLALTDASLGFDLPVWLGFVLVACCAGAAALALFPSLSLHNYLRCINGFLSSPDAHQLEFILKAQVSFWRLVGVLAVAVVTLGLATAVAMLIVSRV
jgi:uncharacterized protein DUF4339